MIYEWQCKYCEHPYTVYELIERRDIPKLCPVHRSVMRRYEVCDTHVSVGSFKEGYQPAFDKVFTSKSQQDDEIRRIRGETGKDLVEVGNDSGFDRPEVKEPDVGSAVREMRSLWPR